MTAKKQSKENLTQIQTMLGIDLIKQVVSDIRDMDLEIAFWTKKPRFRATCGNLFVLRWTRATILHGQL